MMTGESTMTNETNYKKASKIIYLTMVLSLPGIYLQKEYDESLRAFWNGSLIFITLSFIAGFLWTGALAYKIGQGKRWAILVYTIPIILGFVFTIANPTKNFDMNAVYGLFTYAVIGIQGYIIYLLRGSMLQSVLDLKNKTTIPKVNTDNISINKSPDDISHKQQGLLADQYNLNDFWQHVNLLKDKIIHFNILKLLKWVGAYLILRIFLIFTAMYSLLAYNYISGNKYGAYGWVDGKDVLGEVGLNAFNILTFHTPTIFGTSYKTEETIYSFLFKLTFLAFIYYVYKIARYIMKRKDE